MTVRLQLAAEGGAAPRLLRRLPPGYLDQNEGQGVFGREAAR
ncbi:hypothetical protein FALB51S_03716 [Frigidibacter albus]|uniref:Uncharacterized protein n=1 Tax=Frigidibacter mobilis TaxID=1335048 RepID=A0A159Z4K1_9RHOB|nr:hypothetical protein AKL17_2875 [Frigidibacter mobilis]